MHGRSRATSTATTSRPSGYAGEAYLALILELLALEQRDRERIERRAVGVLATMAIIVTVLATLLSGKGISGIRLGPWASLLAAEAAVIFLGAGLFAWLTMIPSRYLVAAIPELRRIVESEGFWAADPHIGTRRSAETHLDHLESTREANRRKAWTLTVAMGLELMAVAVLIASVVAYLSGA